ncbi:hypothetical protein AGABI2DRAFT_114133 [Agaricus bisporus var. bisporus H97]|uniref:hypothetical protein n=1 Tax=Agaricus bisporus var. bisporus (strain H97 / ATCC MYA-4626 / FGSC 10389) TaxID=936046 RepID=UPI00029F71C7|nr:hypothetical protein AGABI2DRAFT_114133 [Agaricus bisporus var. bisporus H97]EKV51402.1 hypothetical protein AGABI2DRAFT_114133 [Agaricus bisporus var. bisporus H97]
MDPASPSRLVPGAWPTSPSPSRHRCSSTAGPHLSRHMPNLAYYKMSPRRVIHSYFDSKSALATSTADSTPTSFTFDDLSLQSSLAGTSISSAYMDPFLENSPSKLEQDGSLKCQGGTFGRCQSSSPERVYRESPSPPGDQTYLSLPEIPDLSFLSSLQEDYHTTQDNFNTSNNEPSFLTFDENILETQASSCGDRSLDTLSSSSIRCRWTEVPSLECATQDRQLPQPDGRSSRSLFLSPVSASSQQPSSLPLQLLRTRLGIQVPDSECQNADLAYSNVIRRSWIMGSCLPGPTNGLPEEEASIRRYANEILDQAFHMDADGSVFTLGIPGVDISPKNPPLEVVANSRRRVKLSRIAKRLVHRVLNKRRNEGTIQAKSTNRGPEPIRHTHHGLYSEDLELQVRNSVFPVCPSLGSSCLAYADPSC